MSLDSHDIRPDHPTAEQGEEPIRTLLWTAATVRPLDEVAALVSLLKRTGEFPGSGDEALRAAAVSRPVDEVMQLVALLNEPPHAVDEADTTLRAAAVGRPIEDIAQLVNILGSPEGGPAPAREPVGEPAADPHADPSATGDAGDHPQDPPLDGGTPAPHERQTVRTGPAAGPTAVARLGSAYGDALRAPRRSGPVTGVPRARGAWSPLRSTLRWPAAAALLVISLIHLPADSAGLRSGDYADGVSLVVAVLSLVLSVLLAVQDTVWIWAASAAAAVGVVALHALATGLSSVDLLKNTLSGSFAWAPSAAMACAVLAAALATAALLRCRRAAAVTRDA